jgi:type IV secretory pathway VirB2 component (pilin)
MHRQKNCGKHTARHYLPVVAKLTLLIGFLVAFPLLAQSPWESTATKLATAFTGPIARGLSLVAIVVGGLSLAFSEGGGRRALGGLVFGLGMVMGATSFLTWLFA